VVCEAGADKLSQIEALVAANEDLSLAGSATMNQTYDKIRETNPSLVWIELTPTPEQGFKLLSSLKEQFPDVFCLVSNEKLDASLVKTSMQMGAIDFLDAQTWGDQLPDVITRIKSKALAQIEAKERLEAERAKMREVLEQKAAQPTVSKTNLNSMRKMVTDSKEIESRAVTNLVMIVVVLLLIAGAGFYFMQGR
jgi:DNA-binding NtrC family response regulator